MAINDKDFYASHGLDFDIEEMQIEYTRRVMNQAKIEVLTELQLDIEECVDGAEGSSQFEQGVTIARVQVVEMIQERINKLKGEKDGKNI